MIRVLLACPDVGFHPWYSCDCVGRLLTPQANFGNASLWHVCTAFDNAAYSNWNELNFRYLLLKHSHNAEKTQWVACPDVVGDWVSTAKRFKEWVWVVKSLGYKLAYVLQDGQPNDAIPWGDIHCVFLGGTTEYKLSEEAYETLKIAKTRGKLVHVGRVNSIQRIVKFLDVMDSFDGLSFSFYSKSRLPPIIRFLEKVNRAKNLDVTSCNPTETTE